MASVVGRGRLSARLVSRCTAACTARRAFSRTASDRAAQNFSMPALSPTMTEGNIGKWKVKEGDAYSAGDVLLEVETDKATMDVEAQDDGKMFKIMQQDGAKGVKVGARIAVIAEEGDDLSSLEVPADESKSAQSDQQNVPAPQKESKAAPAASESSKSDSQTQPAATSGKRDSVQSGKAQKQRRPLFPAVQQLLLQSGLSKEDADSIPGSGPGGRLLKGDVLAHLGKISKEYPAESSARLAKLSHLDLSNIQLAKPAPKSEEAKPAAPEANVSEQLPEETEIAVPISLAAVIATQKRVQDTLGIFLPLSVFIARASELANDDLPASKTKQPTAEDLFNSVLGLNRVAKSARGNFVPQVTGIAPYAATAARPHSAKKADIIDMLASPKAKTSRPTLVRAGALGVAAGENIFSVTARLGDEARAAEYLERMKLALEKEPGRLVL